MDKKTLLSTVEGFPLIGWCVHWSGMGFELPYEDFVKLLEEAGIPKSVARQTLPKNAYLRAVKMTAKGKTTFARKVLEESDKSVSVIAKEAIDPADLTYETNQQSTVIFDKDSRDIKVQGAAAKDIKAKFEQYKEYYTASQFRSVVLRYVQRECDGFMVKDGGGLYFVPSFKETEFNKLQHLFELMAKKFKVELGAIPIVDTKAARSSMWASMIGRTKEEIERLEQEIDGMDEVTNKSFELRVKKYKDLRTKTEMYETLLEGTAKDLKSSLDKLTKRLKDKMEA